jgi:hypothetical protein
MELPLKKGFLTKFKGTDFLKFAKFAKQKHPYSRINFRNQTLKCKKSHCSKKFIVFGYYGLLDVDRVERFNGARQRSSWRDNGCAEKPKKVARKRFTLLCTVFGRLSFGFTAVCARGDSGADGPSSCSA